MEVCESAQTKKSPGCVMPSSGPTTCTMPCRGSCRPKVLRMPCAFVLRSKSSSMVRISGSFTPAMPWSRLRVGT